MLCPSHKSGEESGKKKFQSENLKYWLKTYDFLDYESDSICCLLESVFGYMEQEIYLQLVYTH